MLIYDYKILQSIIDALPKSTKEKLKKFFENDDAATFLKNNNFDELYYWADQWGLQGDIITAILLKSDLPLFFDYCVTIHKNMFDALPIIEIDIGDNIKKIDSYAFADCLLLEKIKLPGNLHYISDSAFIGCKKLTQIYIDDRMDKYDDSECRRLFKYADSIEFEDGTMVLR